MAAEKGNSWWTLRAKHGRDKLFDNPILLWEAACEYFQWCEDNPFQEAQLTTYQGQSSVEEVPKMRPFTLEGLCLYCDCNSSYFRNFKTQERQNKEDFSVVIAQIEEIIRNQQFSGAASGFLNGNIVSRYLGLKDASIVENEVTVKGDPFSNIRKNSGIEET